MPEDHSPPPVVTIVTIFHNRAVSVLESVASLLDQSKVSIEIIAVDDGSTDDTLSKLREVSDPRLTVIAQANIGFTRSMNDAIGRARGRYIAVHGAGDISLPDRIFRQAAILDAEPEIGIVGCYVRNDAKTGRENYVVRPPSGLPLFKTLLDHNLFTHGEVMYRRDVFHQVGGYRPFFTFAQDRDLWLRMSQKTGYAIVPDVLYVRRRFPDGVGSDLSKLLLQLYASDFAVQLAEGAAASNWRPDLLEREGPLAALLRKRSPGLARRIAWTGARQMITGDVQGGWSLVSTALRERLTPQVFAIWLLCGAHQMPILWPIAQFLLKRRLLSFDRDGR